MPNPSEIIPIERIERNILLIRGQKVILDEILAELYGVETKVLNQAVKRNLERFPSDFMFQLDRQEFAALKSQIVTSKTGRGGRRTPPYAFTEQGIAMLSSVLNSRRAIDVNIGIMRAFVRLRELLLSNQELNLKLAEMEDKYEEQFKIVFTVLEQLMAAPEPGNMRRIGFNADLEE